jgi:hypothetical protein
MTLTNDTKEWLLEAPEPYIRYQAQLLLEPGKADHSLLDRDPFIQAGLKAASGWKDEILQRHDKPDLFIHKLAMLADLGVTKETKGASRIVEGLLGRIAEDGSLRIKISVPVAFGGSGLANEDWLICDFPVILYALLRMAPGDARLEPAVDKLLSLGDGEYYPCCGSIAKFKGPGPRNGMCPYANLLVARALAAHDSGKLSSQAMKAAQAVLRLWSERKEKKPFMFGMGTDFKKIKFPMVWFNLLHVVSGLREIGGIAQDERFTELASLLAGKFDPDGKLGAESVYLCYKDQEWGSKKGPSRLLTILAHKALRGPDPSRRSPVSRARA